MRMKEQLKNAICNNNIDFLEANKKLYSINERFEDEDNDTLLLYSISDEGSSVYDYLLKNNADINLLNDAGENLIHGIVFSGDNKRLKTIINEYTVDINHQSNDGATPLLLAISLEKYEIALSLIQYGANVTIGDCNGITPLHLASQLSNVTMVKLLLEKGASFLLKSKAGNLPLALAVNSGNTDVVKFLYEKMYGRL